jgi:predicted nucleotidyltransferase
MICLLSREALQILARKGRIELIRTLRAYTDEDFTINELARVSGVPTMTTWRAIKDLKKAGLVKTRRVGNAISVLLTDDKEKLRSLKIVPETDPQRTAAELYASRLGSQIWLEECRLFGNIGRGVHAPGEDIDVAVVFNDEVITEGEAKLLAGELASKIKAETNVAIVPFCIARRDMGRRGGLAAELRDKEVIWSR